MRRLALFAFAVLTTLTAAYVVWELRQAVVVLALSLAGAAAIAPIVNFWIERKVPRAAALGLAYGLVLGAVALLLSFTASPLVLDLEGTADELASAYKQLHAQWLAGADFRRAIALHLPSGTPAPGASPSGVAGDLLGFALRAVGALGESAIIVILSIFWSSSSQSFERLWLSLLPVDQRGAAREAWEAIKSGVGEQIRSDVVQTLIAIVLLLAGFHAMDLPHPTLPAAAGGLFRLVPLVGIFLAVLTTVLSEIATSPLLAAFAALYVVAVLLLLQLVVAPRFLRSRRYSPLLTTILIVAFTDAYGLAGLVVAPAAAAATQIFFERLLAILQPVAPPPREIAHVEERVAKLQELLAERGPEASPELVSVVERLTSLVASAEEVTP